MDPDDWWAALIEDLRSWATEVTPRPDSIDVLWTWPGGAPREATVVVTPEEWDGVVGITFGSLGLALVDLRAQLQALSGPRRFLVHQQYRLVPSATAEATTPRAGMPEGGSGDGGRWYVDGPDGKEYPFPEPPTPPR